MKKPLLLLILLLTYQLGISQCTADATNFGNNTNSGYAVSGSVSVVLNTDNTVTLNLGNDFKTASGPDIQVYLVNPKSVSDSKLKTTAVTSSDIETIHFGELAVFSGASSFTVDIPSGADISKFSKVFFYCFEFSQFWDFGSFTPFDATNCSSVLDIEKNEFSKTSIFPNPANDRIQISSPTDARAKILIFDTLGKVVYQKETRLNQGVDVSNLKAGIYILSVTSDRKNISKKLVIK